MNNAMETPNAVCPDCTHAFADHGIAGCIERHYTGETSPGGVRRQAYCACLNDIRDLKAWLNERPVEAA